MLATAGRNCVFKHPAVSRRYLDKYMLPEFGDTVPADITPAMAARLLARLFCGAQSRARNVDGTPAGN
jgi:hypothetical protein